MLQREASHDPAPKSTPGMTMLLSMLVATAAAPKPASASPEERASRYPKVNTATAYVVEPHWPQKPPEAAWEAVPGVAVDAHDQVWLFTRALPPVQVYGADGHFIRAWGDDKLTG